MLSGIVRRVLSAFPLVLAVVLVAFWYLRALPGDPVDVILGQTGSVSQAAVSALRQQLHLNGTLVTQLGYFLGRLLHGDLGYSFVQHLPVRTLILQAFPASVELATGAMLFATLVGVPLGIVGGRRVGGAGDRISMVVAFVAVSMPEFWFGLVLMVIFAVRLHWLPVGGQINPVITLQTITGMDVVDSILTGNMPALVSSVRHLILPSVALGTPMVAVISRVLRAGVSETLKKDHVTVAYSKGLSRRSVLWRHVLRNAWIPTLAVTALNLGVLLGGNMVVETVFGWPGLGRLVVQAIYSRDYPLVQGGIMVYGLTFILINLVVDVLAALLNPQITL